VEEKNEAIARIQKKRIRALRMLAEDRKRIEDRALKSTKRDIVDDYSNHASTVYAPATRTGIHPDKNGPEAIRPFALQSYHMLLDLEKRMPARVIQSRAERPEVGAPPKNAVDRKEQLVRVDLEKVYDLIEQRKAGKVPKEMSKYSQRVEKKVERPPTPSIDDNGEEVDSEETQAIIFLQRLIRGRASQNMMFEGKEKRLELIRELAVSTETDPEAAQVVQEGTAAESEEDGAQKALIGSAAGEIIGDALDFLNKELVRLQEEKRISALVMLAERTRRMREAEEQGRREREVELRAREDAQFRQLMGVHRGSVDQFLQDVVVSAVDKRAEEEAREDASTEVERIARLAEDMDKMELDTETVVRDLFTSFLIPEVDRVSLRQQASQLQKRFRFAATSALDAVVPPN
jgi:hypothetical protein